LALDEQLRRLCAAAEAKALEQGGVTLLSKVMGVVRGSIQQGLKELAQRAEGSESHFRIARRNAIENEDGLLG
jgi:hypothetical protein